MDLPGIRYLPGQGWFWQQNSEGRYVDALRLVDEKIEVRCYEKVRCRGSVYVCLCRNVPARICLGRNRCKH
ncbi:hypothetical protein DQC86_24005 [Salmonella enterica subsp. enterica]|nr:hypothetical protein [Salmonella enterica subsp. enterica]